MNIKICDFCKKSIPDDSPAMVTITVTQFGHGLLPVPEHTHLDSCLQCSAERGILKPLDPQPYTVEPNVGALTPEEIERLAREA